MKKKIINFVLFCLLCFALYIGLQYAMVVKPETLNLENGDLIFQNKMSIQSPAIAAATDSKFTHVGIIYIKDHRYFVIDSGLWGVRINRFDTWVTGGLAGKFIVMRRALLTDSKKERIINEVLHYVGRPYDYQFSLDNESIYCSELPYLAYKKVKINIGEIQTISDLNTDNLWVETLMKFRWKSLPACKNEGMDFEACKQIVLRQRIITPESLASGTKMMQIYSNF